PRERRSQMAISRRSFFRTLGAGAAASGVLPWTLERLAGAAVLEPPRPQEPDGLVHLDSNENAYGPSEKTKEAIRPSIRSPNRYPYKYYDPLTEKIAALHRISPEQVVLGCGSTEILRVSAQTFVAQGKILVQAAPTFEALGHYSQSVSAKVLPVPLAHDYSH